jgi:hypothetical protein
VVGRQPRRSIYYKRIWAPLEPDSITLSNLGAYVLHAHDTRPRGDASARAVRGAARPPNPPNHLLDASRAREGCKGVDADKAHEEEDELEHG